MLHSLFGAKTVVFHFQKDVCNIYDFQKPFTNRFEFDTGHNVGTKTYDWELDFMGAKDRKLLTGQLQGEVDRRGWKAARAKGDASTVDVYTDL